MTLVFEDPLPVLFVGVLAQALLVLAFFHTRRWEIFFAVAGVAVLMAGALVVDWLVVTDREAIESQLETGAQAFVRGDLDTVMSVIAPEAHLTRQRAAYALHNIKFEWIKLRNLEITVNRLTSPPTAEATFQAAIRFEDRYLRSPYRYDEIRLRVEFVLTDSGWLVTDHVEAYDTP